MAVSSEFYGANVSYQEIKSVANFMRRKILDVSYSCGLSTHLGGGLSMVEIMATLYVKVLKLDKSNLTWESRDRFILSKGHGVLGYFSALLAAGIISEDTYSTFLKNGSHLIAHPVMNMDLGIESSNGSLGQGLSMAIGIALAAKKQAKPYRVYVLVGDGECNEGSIWEAAMLAPQLKLSNLTLIVDYNKLQSDGDAKDIIDLGSLSDKFNSFGWKANSVDGHDIAKLIESFELEINDLRPRALICDTIKGKGVSFMENNNEWHHNRLTKVNYELALAELDAHNQEFNK